MNSTHTGPRITLEQRLDDLERKRTDAEDKAELAHERGDRAGERAWAGAAAAYDRTINALRASNTRGPLR